VDCEEDEAWGKKMKSGEKETEEDRLLREIERLLTYRISRCGVKAAKRNEEELELWRSFAKRELSTYLRLMREKVVSK